mgnify:CR=1 FL=1
MTDELHEWARSLDTLQEQAWKRLGRGVADRRAPARHPTLATVDREGMPQARTVVLRAADPDPASLKVYTDRYADKVDEVSAHPYAAIHVWDNTAHLQLRLTGGVAIHTGAAIEPIWSQLSDHARNCYGFHPASGQSMSEALAYDVQPDPGSFAVLELMIQRMDVLHLGNRHRRAQFSRSDDWAGQWVVP